MSQLPAWQCIRTALLACIILGINGITPAQAEIVASSPSLPLLDIPYMSLTGGECFTVAGVCGMSGSLTLTSVLSSTFDVTGQDIITNATYTTTVTDLFGTPLGSVDLTGTMEQEVLGRTSDSDTGTWDIAVTALSLSGTLLGDAMTMTLDPDIASFGATSIAADGDGSYLMSGFFSIYGDLSLASTPPQVAEEVPFDFVIPVPEPAGLALLTVPMLALAIIRRRR